MLSFNLKLDNFSSNSFKYIYWSQLKFWTESVLSVLRILVYPCRKQTRTFSLKIFNLLIFSRYLCLFLFGQNIFYQPPYSNSMNCRWFGIVTGTPSSSHFLYSLAYLVYLPKTCNFYRDSSRSSSKMFFPMSTAPLQLPPIHSSIPLFHPILSKHD